MMLAGSRAGRGTNAEGFIIGLVRDIKSNGCGYLKSESTVLKVKAYAPEIEIKYDKLDKIYIATFKDGREHAK